MVKVGTCIDNRYEVLGLLGRGGMGKVYRVRHQSLLTEHALKELDCAGFGATDQFQLEARILAKLQHPGLPRVIDYFSRNSKHYLVMDYIAGEDLQDLLDRCQGRPLDEARVLDWMGQLLGILGYIHAEGIVHRDIKPANLKLTPAGRIVLVDFGIAKSSQATNLMTAFGAKGAFTPFLAAPEQISGQGTDPRTDLYAVGATAAYLLTGILPLQLANLSPAAETWIRKALAHLPAQRYPDAAAMRQALPGTGVIPLMPPGGPATFRRDIRRK
ncbi:MAG: serine/threonine-protein kinase [Candidatus Sericytochromatia bacterium]